MIKEHHKRPKKCFVVGTHLGQEFTLAPSPNKALNNVRFRMRRRGLTNESYCQYWTVREWNGGV